MFQSNLLKRLDTATKELRSNTKSKKMALSKLEEATTTSDNLKKELEQMTRDKEILESKMKVLQDEYEKLQKRVLSKQSSNGSSNFYGQAQAEKDVCEGNLNCDHQQTPNENDVVQYSLTQKVSVHFKHFY